MKEVNILSSFDNICQAKQACDNLGIEAEVYFHEATDEDLQIAYKREATFIGNIPLNYEYVPDIDLLILYIPRYPMVKIMDTGRTMLEEIERLVKNVRPKHLIAYKKYTKMRVDKQSPRKHTSNTISQALMLERQELDGTLLGGETPSFHIWSTVDILPITPNKIRILDVIERAELIRIKDIYPDIQYQKRYNRIKGIPGIAMRDRHVYGVEDQLIEVNPGRRSGNRFKVYFNNDFWFLSAAHIEGIKGITEANFTAEGINGKKYSETARMRIIGRAQQIIILEHLLASWYVATQ